MDSKSIEASASPVVTKESKQGFWSELRGYAEALLVAFFIVTFVFNTVGVVGSSMRPNLHGGNGRNLFQSIMTGDRVFIPKLDTWLRRARVLGGYRRGDVVVVREPANSPTAQDGGRRPFFIKRVIGVPGDRLRIVGGQVFINDVQLDQGFISASGEIRPDPNDFPVVVQQGGKVTALVISFLQSVDQTPYPDLPINGFYPDPVSVEDPRVELFYGDVIANLESVPPGALEGVPILLDFVVPPGMYFVMGDNRQNSKGGSEDSRYFGPIRSLSIAGKATAVIWPPQRDGVWNWRRLEPPAAFAAIPDSESP